MAGLEQQLVLLGELCGQYVARLPSDGASLGGSQMSLVTSAADSELSHTRATLQLKTQALEAARARIEDLESVLMSKDKCIDSHREQFDALVAEHSEKLRALEQKYSASKCASIQLESVICNLEHRLTLAQQGRIRRHGNNPQSSPLSPDCSHDNPVVAAAAAAASSPSSNASSSPNGHSLGAKPEVAPPSFAPPHRQLTLENLEESIEQPDKPDNE